MPEREEQNTAGRLEANAVEGDELAQRLLLLGRPEMLEAELPVAFVDVIEHALDDCGLLVGQTA